MHENKDVSSSLPRINRIQAPNVHGQRISINSGQGAFTCLHPVGVEGSFSHESVHILLGIGYNSGAQYAHATLEMASTKVFYLENPALEVELSKQGVDLTTYIPKHWQKLVPSELVKLMESSEHPMVYWWFKQNLLLDTTFWMPILAQILANYRSTAAIAAGLKQTTIKQVLMGSCADQLLHREICTAFEELSFETRCVGINPKNPTLSMPELSEQSHGAQLFFSINLQGLDADGYTFSLMQGLNIAVAVWFVDNPWHVLTKLRLPWWKKAHLFVTDASFINDLRREGAENVYHLPLATAQHMYTQTQENLTAQKILDTAQCIFVGRAAFPDKAHFFAASPVQEADMQAALTLLDLDNSAQKPDFHWWTQRIFQENSAGKFWPKNEVRRVGHGAELCAQAQRVQWLKALTGIPCAVFGDAPLWQALLPQAPAHIFHNELDYYGSLAAVYGNANSVLNVTSLLLPHGLTQRHFDVWAAGGFLWTNDTPGLDIFPKELTRPITCHRPKDLLSRIKNLSAHTRHELIQGWQECLKAQHQYTHRLRFVLERVL